MIHELTIGHFDLDALVCRQAVSIKPLDETTVARVLAEFPMLTVEQRDGYLVAPWHGRENAEFGEAFAARIQSETGCMVVDRRNGRVAKLAQKLSARATG